jgi:hypothetical protein
VCVCVCVCVYCEHSRGSFGQHWKGKFLSVHSAEHLTPSWTLAEYESQSLWQIGILTVTSGPQFPDCNIQLTSESLMIVFPQNIDV